MKRIMAGMGAVLLLAGVLACPGRTFGWTGETWGDSTRGEIVRRAELMMDLSWSPNRPIRMYGYPTEVYHTFNSYTVYTGMAYTQNNPQENWAEFTAGMQALEFSPGSTVTVVATSLNMREGAGTAFPVVTTLSSGDTGTIVADFNNATQPAGSSFYWYHCNFSSQTGWCAGWSDTTDAVYLALYDTDLYEPGIGNDCSGFVSIAWTLGSRYATTTFETDATGAGGYVDSLGDIGTCQSAGLITGDACNKSGSHIILFNRDLGGGQMESMEQTPWVAYRRTWYWSSLSDYRPIRRRQLVTSPTPAAATPSPVPKTPSPVPNSPTRFPKRPLRPLPAPPRSARLNFPSGRALTVSIPGPAPPAGPFPAATPTATSIPSPGITVSPLPPSSSTTPAIRSPPLPSPGPDIFSSGSRASPQAQTVHSWWRNSTPLPGGP